MTDLNGSRGMRLIAGNSNHALAQAIGQYLNLAPVKAQVRRFADMEVFVEVQENVRGEDMFVIQSTSFPANDNLMELLIMIDALRRASARRITAVIPYFGYARQDRKVGPRTPISAKLVANMITEAGANRVLTVDLHAGQIQGFFDIPTDNLFAMPVMVRDILDHLGENLPMVVSPDVGGVVRARALARRLGTDLAIVDKRRERRFVRMLVLESDCALTIVITPPDRGAVAPNVINLPEAPGHAVIVDERGWEALSEWMPSVGEPVVANPLSLSC